MSLTGHHCPRPSLLCHAAAEQPITPLRCRSPLLVFPIPKLYRVPGVSSWQWVLQASTTVTCIWSQPKVHCRVCNTLSQSNINVQTPGVVVCSARHMPQLKSLRDIPSTDDASYLGSNPLLTIAVVVTVPFDFIVVYFDLVRRAACLVLRCPHPRDLRDTGLCLYW